MLAAEDLGDPLIGLELITALPVMLAVAFLSGRLLGVRRSWASRRRWGSSAGWPQRASPW